jgi:hypothetical protein
MTLLSTPSVTEKRLVWYSILDPRTPTNSIAPQATHKMMPPIQSVLGRP